MWDISVTGQEESSGYQRDDAPPHSSTSTKLFLSVIAYTYFLRGPVHVLLCLTMRGELRSLKPSWLRVDFTETRRPGCTWLSLCGHLSHLLGKNWCNSMTEILFYQAAVSLSLILLHTLLAIDLLLLFFFFLLFSLYHIWFSGAPALKQIHTSLQCL